MGRADPIRPPQGVRHLAEEVPLALVYNGTTHAVMMGTPADLEDFAVGFSVTEGIVAKRDEIAELEVVSHGPGIELRMWLDGDRAARLDRRRRTLAGPVGCGLCGIDSIEAAMQPAARIGTDDLRLSPSDLWRAMRQLVHQQPLHADTGAVHAAGLWRDGRLATVREDVGRHNALDKLVGAEIRADRTGAGAAVVLTSRVSVEMVQKAAALGAEAILAVSAPTALAVRMAETAGLTLITNLRGHAYRVLTHPHRLIGTDLT